MTSPKTIQSIYTDGACSGNPGPGGWGVAIYFDDGSVHELGGTAAATTNNRMEMQAAIAALQFLAKVNPPEPVALYTDSEYVKNGVTKWVAGWKKKGWKTAQGKPVLNQDLWQILDELNSKQVEWRYVRGHAGNVGNERCDAIARAFSLGKTPLLQQTSFENGFAETNGLATATSFSPVSSTIEAFGSNTTDRTDAETIQSSVVSYDSPTADLAMMDSTVPSTSDPLDNLPREVRVAQLHNLVETLRMADEIAEKG
jgi:ribonuclease HI